MNIWVASTFVLLWLMMLWAFVQLLGEHMFSVLLVIYLLVEFLDQKVLYDLQFVELTICFSEVAAP